MLPAGDTQNTLRGVHGAIIFDTLRNAGHNITIQNNQITIVPKPGIDIVRLQEKLQTLVETKKISLDTIKIGMLYSSPTFAKYAADKQTVDKIVSQSANPQDFIKYVKDLKTA